MNVGSISGAGRVGGRNGVGVAREEQAEAISRLKKETSARARMLKRLRVRSEFIIKKGDPSGRPIRAFTLLLRGR